MVSIAYALLGAWLVAMAAVDGAPIESSAVTIAKNKDKLSRFGVVAGRKVSDEATEYKIPKLEKVLSRAEARIAAADNSSDSRHLLATTSTDVQRLEEHFGAAMERKVDTLLTGIYRAASVKPVPWPSSYWPNYLDGINFRWAGANVASPAEKYATAFGKNVAAFTKAISEWNGILSNTGNRACRKTSECSSLNDGSACGMRRGATSGYCIPTWWGICHAWAPAAILEKEPRCAVKKGSTTFQPFDIKALITQVYDDSSIGIVFTGARFNGPDSPQNLDEYGRFKDAARRDVGPGFFHIACTNILARFGLGFIVDGAAGSEVWNQPVRGYEILATKELTRTQAANQYYNTAQYPFNAAATKLMYVKMRLQWMNEAYEDGPLIENGRADAYTGGYDLEYLLEMNTKREIIGGEWLRSSNTQHPDFLWFPAKKPDPSTVTTVGLSYAHVLELLDASISCGSVDPTPTPTPTPSNGCATTGGSCGNENVGAQCCATADNYCFPVSPVDYRCSASAAQCTTPETGIDFYGNDLVRFYSLTPESCCAACINTPGCTVYTFKNYHPDDPENRSICYLKSSDAGRQSVVGVVSARVR